ncbi:MAG: CDGSH iron-sulfur domain-containing protein [Methanomassiliicoccaceae archaeon]|nr:CDGSH iron-sulfur domain-containing protein [Methanomassiliicoccaceae archaeon]
MSDGNKIKVTKNGPYIVYGGVPLKEEVLEKDAMGKPDRWADGKKHYPDETYALCRCGRSGDKPFCSGDHGNFDGTETAPRNTFAERAKICHGDDGVALLQDPALCVGDGFCHGRHKIESTVKKKKTLDIALQQTYDCSGGSLVITIDGEIQEPKLEKSISATSAGTKRGPFWVKGGIPVESSDGYVYEVRNRVALCSCGRSENKPFCDAAHLR